MARKTRFTIYDQMNESGVFEGNPANASAPTLGADGKPFRVWPAPYPKMLYHPEGKRKITVRGEIQMTPMGPISVNEQSEIINMVVANEAEHKKALEAGWWETPAEAQAVAEGKAKSPEEQDAELEAEIRALQRKQNDLRARNQPRAVGAEVE